MQQNSVYAATLRRIIYRDLVKPIQKYQNFSERGRLGRREQKNTHLRIHSMTITDERRIIPLCLLPFLAGELNQTLLQTKYTRGRFLMRTDMST